MTPDPERKRPVLTVNKLPSEEWESLMRKLTSLMLEAALKEGVNQYYAYCTDLLWDKRWMCTVTIKKTRKPRKLTRKTDDGKGIEE